MNWQSIDTAPKDGTEVLLWREDVGVILGRWIAPIDFLTDAEVEALHGPQDVEEPDWFGADFIAGYRISNDGAPTHWMPLPGAPADAGELHK